MDISETRSEFGCPEAGCDACFCLKVCGSLGKTITIAHLELTAYQWTILVNRTHHGISVQGGAPTIIQSRHGLSPPSVDFGKSIWHAGIGNEQNLQPAAAGLATGTGHRGLRWARIFVFFMHLFYVTVWRY
jgi:hypothetical protein